MSFRSCSLAASLKERFMDAATGEGPLLSAAVAPIMAQIIKLIEMIHIAGFFLRVAPNSGVTKMGDGAGTAVAPHCLQNLHDSDMGLPHFWQSIFIALNSLTP